MLSNGKGTVGVSAWTAVVNGIGRSGLKVGQCIVVVRPSSRNGWHQREVVRESGIQRHLNL